MNENFIKPFIILFSFYILLITSCYLPETLSYYGTSPTVEVGKPITTSPFHTLVQIFTLPATNSLTPSLTQTLTATPSKTSTIQPTSTEDRAIVAMKIRCQSAFDLPIRDGIPKLPAILLVQRDYLEDETPNQALLALIENEDSGKIQTLICVRESREQVLSYADGEQGYQRNWDIRLVSWPDGTVIKEKKILGYGPPAVKITIGPGYGAAPRGELRKWLLCDLEIGHPSVFCGAFGALAFSPDGKLLAAGETVWDVLSGKKVKTLTQRKVWVDSLAFSPDGKLLAGGGLSSMQKHAYVYLWETSNWTVKKVFESILPSVNNQSSPTLAFNGEILAYRSALWQVSNGKLLFHFEEEMGRVFAHSRQFNTLIEKMGNIGDTRFEIWDSLNGLKKTDLNKNRSVTPLSQISAVVFSDDGSVFAMGNNQGTIQLWDVATGTLRTEMSGHQGTITALAFSPDQNLLASAGIDGTINLWKVSDGKIYCAMKGQEEVSYHLSFTPDGSQLAAEDHGMVILWDLVTACVAVE